jgi:IMP cyclohydrolase
MDRVVIIARLVLCGLLILAAASCSITATTGRSAEELELARNRQRWASAGLHDYEYDFQRMCFCVPDATEAVHIVVRQDVVISVVRTRDGQPASTRVTTWPRIDELFAEVQQRLDQRAERLDVRYDATYGYPRSIVVDIALMAADDEYSLTADNLRRLP